MDSRALEKYSGDVRIVNFAETRVAALEHRDSAKSLFETIGTFIKWCRENNLPPGNSATYNIIYPPSGEGNDYPIDLCAAITAEVGENPYGVVNKVIPGGRCAVLRHIGADDNIGASFNYLYARWLPQSGESPRDFPCFFHRVTLFPDVAEHEMITDIYLPLI
jgi:AraC family transcriptional regulator